MVGYIINQVKDWIDAPIREDDIALTIQRIP